MQNYLIIVSISYFEKFQENSTSFFKKKLSFNMLRLKPLLWNLFNESLSELGKNTTE